MARPILSDTSFLGYLFAPKKHEKPAGIRKVKLSGTKGRTKGRLAAFNRMSSTNQELLKRAGLRDAYLRGDTTLVEARRSIRPQAVSLGIARPLPLPTTTTRIAPVLSRRQQIDLINARHIKRVVAGAGKKFNGPEVDRRVRFIPDDFVEDIRDWNYDQIRGAASNGSPFETIEENARFNPFWYR